MVRISWGSEKNKTYEIGLEKGLLKVEGSPVVAWDGLVSVKENYTDNLRPIYQDGFRIYNYAAYKEFSATIEAIDYPEEFSQCEGIGQDPAAAGLFLDQQFPKTFHFAYRTGIGSALSSSFIGYKLHLVYNCTAAPSSKTHTTLSDSTESPAFNWDVETVPMRDISGVLPFAHLSINSTKAKVDNLKQLEDILYGTETSDPRFLEPSEVKTILSR